MVVLGYFLAIVNSPVDNQIDLAFLKDLDRTDCRCSGTQLACINLNFQIKVQGSLLQIKFLKGVIKKY